MNNRLGPFSIFISVISVFAALATAQTPTATTAPASLPPEAIDRLIHELASPRWTIREAAGNALMDAGTPAYRALRSAFRVTSSYEVRKRIKRVAMEIYLAEQLGPPRAFLGIQHRGVAVPDSGDERVPPWASALSITDVIHGTGADRAGLRRGDLLMALNGQTGTKGFPAIEFTRWIASQKPGTVCLLNVVRGGEGIRLDSVALSGFVPADLSRAQVRAVRHEEDPRVPYEAAGILIEGVGGVGRKLRKESGPHVEAGDLLLSIDDEAIPLEGTLERFQRWYRGEHAGKTPEPPVAQGLREPSTPHRPSVHLLRGGEGFDMEVTLGRRPVYLDDLSFRAPRGADPTPLEQALSSFSTWWQETFDPQGLLSDTADEDPRWELEPRWGGR